MPSKESGIEVVLVNPNFVSIQTDKKSTGEKAYFSSSIPEFVEKVIEKERPGEILLWFNCQTP
jgi:carbamoylphosphate synthase large subunit